MADEPLREFDMAKPADKFRFHAETDGFDSEIMVVLLHSGEIGVQFENDRFTFSLQVAERIARALLRAVEKANEVKRQSESS